MKKKIKLYISNRILVFIILISILLFTSLMYIGTRDISQGRYLFFLVYTSSLLILMLLAYRWIYVPYKEINRVLLLFSQDYIFKGIFDMRMFLNRETHLVLDKFKEIIDTKELIEGSKKHAEYLALQNQINPHFLYNTLDGIRSEALIEGVDSIANMTEALGTFFRYTISNIDRFVTLDAEIKNIENYYKIQEFRFGDKLSFDIIFQTESPDTILQAKVPKLTLQPFFENAIFHGLEKKLGKGILTLKIAATNHRLIITVSDNGIGMEEERVQELNQKLKGASLKYLKEDGSQGGIALLNVNSRIKLIFGDEYGVYIYSRLGVGTDVEITMPLILEGKG